MKLRQEICSLVCKLTESEIAKKGQELAKLCDDISQAEDDEATRSKSAKSAIKGLEANRNVLAGIVEAGEEYRPIQVSYDIEGSEVTESRMDTGELIQKRPATKQEMQQRLSFEVNEVAK